MERLCGDGVSAEAVPEHLRDVTFKLIPLENVNGRRKVEKGDLCERKNGRGVDTNRNFKVHWGFKEKDYDPAEEFPGAEPLSEPEAWLIDAMARRWRPHAWVNVHSGMEAMFVPYDHRATITTTSVGTAMPPVLKELNRRHCRGKCAVGSGGKEVGYLAHGTASDHMFEELGVPFSTTWEIYGDLRARNDDCFRMFNPLTREMLDDFATRWADMVLSLTELFPREWARIYREDGDSAAARSAAQRATAAVHTGGIVGIGGGSAVAHGGGTSSG